MPGPAASTTFGGAVDQLRCCLGLGPIEGLRHNQRDLYLPVDMFKQCPQGSILRWARAWHLHHMRSCEAHMWPAAADGCQDSEGMAAALKMRILSRRHHSCFCLPWQHWSVAPLLTEPALMCRMKRQSTSCRAPRCCQMTSLKNRRLLMRQKSRLMLPDRVRAMLLCNCKLRTVHHQQVLTPTSRVRPPPC